jgi:serine/threonine protein kinase
MAKTQRSFPYIPDHEVLRKIGGGSYGEVWMAKAVTGAMRAVKIVWREDFDDERTFEREFDGILKYEPISRSHPALVNILHVGRSPDGVSFYYYVMELGDDVHAGQEINPIEYEARTLLPDGKLGARLEPHLCIEVGVQLADALGHLHDNGLAHRDVKPANVIFVNGKAKLADIGLVAARDQRTFVGTEGFVPPEGPGSAQADIYSLGKVLYEIATGKDRLEFPELPDVIPAGEDRKVWLDLNRIICEICEPRISKRRITTAAELSHALKLLQRGKKRSGNGLVWAAGIALLALAGLTGTQTLKDKNLLSQLSFFSKHQGLDAEPKGLVRVVTSPEGAEVFTETGTLIGITPTATMKAKVGTELRYVIRKEMHRPLHLKAIVTPESVEEPMMLFGELRNFSPPIVGEIWEDHYGTRYLPEGDSHESLGFVSKRVWTDFLTTKNLPKLDFEFIHITENGMPSEVVVCSPQAAQAFCDWFRERALREGFLTQNHQVKWDFDDSFSHTGLSENALSKLLKPFRISVSKYIYGEISLSTEPLGADVFLEGKLVGKTEGALRIEGIKPGPVELLVLLEGYKPQTVKTKIQAGENRELSISLEKSNGVVFGEAWQNGIGMKFVPVSFDLMGCIWETRLKDYQNYLAATKSLIPEAPDFPQDGEHPIVNVSRSEAMAFCEWLTNFEREEQRISQTHRYRLPTDSEWSRMAGLNYELGDSPSQRDANKPSIYVWGLAWPPPNGVANYADISASRMPGITPDKVLTEYDDSFPRTAPVGSFAANDVGFFDMSGNVQEWVSDSITGSSSIGVLRGAGWNTYRKESFLLGWRNPVPMESRSPYYGFRIVLARNDPPQEPVTKESPSKE